MRKFLAVLLIAIFLVSISLTAAFSQGNQSDVNDVLQQDEAIRQLQASSSIQVNYLSQDELRQKMIADFETDMPEEKLRDTQDMMIMLGYIPNNTDLKTLMINLLTEQVAGFYDPKDKSLYLISASKTNMSAMDKYILSHELIHYLQDKNFDLNRPPFGDPEGSTTKTDDDASTAADALAEGDAQLTSDSWLAKNMDASDMLNMQQESRQFSTQVLDSAPAYIRDGLLFPYEEGQTFTNYLKRKGGYDAVDGAYNKPPESTEQIYHPEKYTANETPVNLTLNDESATLGESWTMAYENVLGEFDVYELFKPYFSDTKAKLAAAGWGGNKYQYYNNDSGDKLLVQEYAWDSENDAQEFSSAYIKMLDARFKGDIRTESSVGAWQVWSAGGYQMGIKKDGLDTYLLQSTTEEPFAAMLETLGQSGDQIDQNAIGSDTGSNTQGSEKSYKWLVVAGVIGLLAIGLILLIVTFIILRKPPAPPSQPPGGPYGYGGGGYGGQTGPGGGAPWQGGYIPPPPPPGGMPPQPPPANQG